MNDKIQPSHLERIAFVYVRQSSLQQVRGHTEGQRQQYALADRSRALGFRETVLIDEDQGRSGSGTKRSLAPLQRWTWTIMRWLSMSETSRYWASCRRSPQA